jgi:succinate dehydrogenase / fumarate reductase flavoprotein subunit
VVDKHLRYNSEWITAIEVMNMLECAEVMTRAALFRTESRGGHYREDYPLMDNKSWVVETGIRLTKGQIQIYKKPLRFDYLKPGEVGYPEGEDLHTSWWLPLQFPKGIPRD